MITCCFYLLLTDLLNLRKKTDTLGINRITYFVTVSKTPYNTVLKPWLTPW